MLSSRVRLAVIIMTVSMIVSACVEARTPAATPSVTLPVVVRPLPAMPVFTRITGADMVQTTRFGVSGTDLGIPYRAENGSTNYIFGDTGTSASPDSPGGLTAWRSPVILRSNQMPIPGQAIAFDSAAGILGEGIAPEIMENGHRTNGEYTVIPTDGISFPETGNHIISYMSINEWLTDTNDPAWKNNYAGLAWSPDGNRFYRIGPTWSEPPSHDSPFQTWSMQRDGGFVYIISVRAGRRPSTDGPMLLLRVPWDRMLDSNAYQCWRRGVWGDMCSPILKGSFSEPSLRLLEDGKTWVMSYMDVSTPERALIVTRYASAPSGPWSPPKIQLTSGQLWRPYGPYIHHLSTRDRLILMISTHQPHERYDVSFFIGTL